MSYISLLGVAVSTLSLIVVLSLFHGMENLVDSLLKSFDPDIKIEATKGKTFLLNPSIIEQLSKVRGVEKVVEVKEDNVLVTYQDRQLIVKLKGVSENYLTACRLAPHIVSGNLQLKKDGKDVAIIGRGIKYNLSINPQKPTSLLELSYPKTVPSNSTQARKAFSQKKIAPGAIFAIEKEFDGNYILVSLDFANSLFGKRDRRSSFEVQVAPGHSIKKVKRMIQPLLPATLRALDSDEQHAGLIKATKIEKLLVFLVFFLIISVASLNIFFILSMLVLEKQRDISILHVLGARSSTIRSIFLLEGLLISLSGALVGAVVGFGLCFLQQRFGLLSFGSETAIVDAYPVEMHGQDFVFVIATIIITTIIAAYRPAKLASKNPTFRSF